LALPKLDQLFLVEAMNQDIKIQNKKFETLAQLMGAKVRIGR